jgi:nitrite reductase/ring-hydroxylating ferredoxin subunit
MSEEEAGFWKVANKKDLKEGGLLGIELDENRIVLAMVGGKVYAMDAVCSHQGGSLDQGELEGYNLTCPWHHAVFDVRDGNISETTVWAMDQKSFPVKVDEGTGDILVNTSSATTTDAAAATTS